MLFGFFLLVSVNGFTQTYNPMPEYKFSWTADAIAGKLYTEIVLTPPAGEIVGWVGFGIAGSSGGMAGGDMFTAYPTSAATCELQDRKSSNALKELPQEDLTIGGFADWVVDSCSFNGGVFTIAATRAFVTFDEQDLDFVTGPMTLLFAWSKVKPDSPSSLRFHDGGHVPRDVSLWGEALSIFDKSKLESDYDTISLSMPNVSIGNQTSYSCYGFNLTLKDNNATQAIAWEVQITLTNLDYVHHMTLFACSVPAPSGVFGCVTMPPSCQQGILYSWGKGGNAFVLPKAAGLNLAIPNRQYVALQVHYNNVEDLQGLTDSSGMMIYRTNQLRANQSSYLVLGSLAVNLTYGKTEIGLAGMCNETVGKTAWPQVNIYSYFFHAHQRGRRLWTNLIRNGTFVTTIGNNQAYDFNLQKMAPLNPYVTLLPGDQLVTYCVWDTSKDTKNVRYGETTDHEMCINFLAFYPAYNNKSHITCGVNTNSYQASNPGRNSCVLLPDHPPSAYEFKNWTISDYYYLAGGSANCAAGFEGTAELGCSGYGAPFSFTGCRRKKTNETVIHNSTHTNSTVNETSNMANETVAPTPMPEANSAFIPTSVALVWILFFV